MKYFQFILVVLLFLTACHVESSTGNKEKESQSIPPVSQQLLPESWDISPSFKLNGETVIGKRDTLALSYDESFSSREVIKANWYFWGEKPTWKDKSVSVIGVHRETHSIEKVLTDQTGHFSWVNSVDLSSSQLSDATVTSYMEFSKSGRWCLNVYIGNEHVGQIVIEVE